MAAGFRGVILLVTATLILLSISLASLDENTSNFLIFATTFSLAIIILYWKIFDYDSTNNESISSSPTLGQNKSSTILQSGTISPISSEVPDPLDQEIDIPLM